MSLAVILAILKNFIFILILFCFFRSESFSQNGKILSKRKIDVFDSPFMQMVSNVDGFESEYDYLKHLCFYEITYQSDGMEIDGFVIEPKGKGKYPVVIYNRGGNRKFGQLTISKMIKYASRIAEYGYLVIASNYRENDEFGGLDLNDVLALQETVKEFDKADSENIGMLGFSRGGMMTYLALKKSSFIKTAITVNSPTDLFETIRERPEMEPKVFSKCIPNYWNDKKIQLESRSAYYWADSLNKRSSLLILFGTYDKRVSLLIH